MLGQLGGDGFAVDLNIDANNGGNPAIQPPYYKHVSFAQLIQKTIRLRPVSATA
jgi:hypothetical protein